LAAVFFLGGAFGAFFGEGFLADFFLVAAFLEGVGFLLDFFFAGIGAV